MLLFSSTSGENRTQLTRFALYRPEAVTGTIVAPWLLKYSNITCIVLARCSTGTFSPTPGLEADRFIGIFSFTVDIEGSSCAIHFLLSTQNIVHGTNSSGIRLQLTMTRATTTWRLRMGERDCMREGHPITEIFNAVDAFLRV